MREQSIKAIREVIRSWRGKREYTFESKEIKILKNPTMHGEAVLYFRNSVYTFFCDGQLIKIELSSDAFLTMTLSDSPISDNPNGDAIRLKSFLDDFDKEFYKLAENKIKSCNGQITTSDPLFWDL